MALTSSRILFVLAAALALAGCAGSGPFEEVPLSAEVDGYGEIQEGYLTIPAVDPAFLTAPNHRTTVTYTGTEAPGTIVVDPYAKFLYLVEPGGSAIRYPVAVGREGRGFSGQATIGRKAEWPGWTPTANMIRREPEFYGPFAKGIPGGKASPMGARALYLYRGNRDTFYRIHGTNDPSTIGNAGSAGCIRMFNQDIIDLYERVPFGAQVVVRTYEESLALEGVEMANRGDEIPPRTVDPEEVYALVEAEEQRRAAWEAGL